MASLGKILHNQKRKKLSDAAYEARQALKKQISDPALDLETKIQLIQKLDKNKNSSITRYRKRCALTGRPRGVMYGNLGRSKFRDLASAGKLPGIRKASF